MRAGVIARQLIGSDAEGIHELHIAVAFPAGLDDLLFIRNPDISGSRCLCEHLIRLGWITAVTVMAGNPASRMDAVFCLFTDIRMTLDARTPGR